MNFCLFRPRVARAGARLRPLVLAGALWVLVSSPASARDYGLPVDKAAHFGLSYALTDQLMRAGLPPLEASVGVFALGVLKEVFDERFDVGDLAADAAGVAVAATVHWQFKF